MPYSIQLPDGTLVENIPDEIDPSTAKARIIAQHPELGPKPKTGIGAAVGVVRGGGELPLSALLLRSLRRI